MNRLAQVIASSRIPIEVEIGFGMSHLIHDLAEENPLHHFIGLDISARACKKAAEHLKRYCLDNITLLQDEAKEFLSQEILFDRLRRVHIYFPTTAPLRARLLNSEFEGILFRSLRENGEVRIVTDHWRYFTDFSEVFNNGNWNNQHWTPLPVLLPSGRVTGTGCEAKHGSKYKVIYTKTEE